MARRTPCSDPSAAASLRDLTPLAQRRPRRSFQRRAATGLAAGAVAVSAGALALSGGAAAAGPLATGTDALGRSVTRNGGCAAWAERAGQDGSDWQQLWVTSPKLKTFSDGALSFTITSVAPGGATVGWTASTGVVAVFVDAGRAPHASHNLYRYDPPARSGSVSSADGVTPIDHLAICHRVAAAPPPPPTTAPPTTAPPTTAPPTTALPTTAPPTTAPPTTAPATTAPPTTTPPASAPPTTPGPGTPPAPNFPGGPASSVPPAGPGQQVPVTQATTPTELAYTGAGSSLVGVAAVVALLGGGALIALARRRPDVD